MAEIFLAEAPNPAGGPPQVCVIKRILPQLQARPEVIDMFLTEADICALLRHENLVEVYEASEVSGRYYMAMEYVQGLELARFMAIMEARREACPAGLAVTLGMKLARGLDYLHRATTLTGKPLKLVHRDVNPSNVFLVDSGDVKLGDLGVARVAFLESYTAPNAPLKGKLRYLAPELLLKNDGDQRLDVYTVGVTLWEVLAGRRAFDRPKEDAVMSAIVNEGLPRIQKLRPDISKGLARTIDRALSVDPSKRQQSAAELYRELKAIDIPSEHWTKEQVAQLVAYARSVEGHAAAPEPEPLPALPRTDRVAKVITAVAVAGLAALGVWRLLH